MKKQHWIITSLIVLTTLAFGLVGCQNFENNSVTTPELGAQPDFIVGDAEIDDWGGQYGEGNAYFMLNIPVTGAMQIAYTLQGGGSYNLFGIAGAATKQEIGLKDGDLLESACVSYDGSAAFSAISSNAQESQKRDFLQYQRLNDDGSVSEWWSNTAGFEFSGDTTTVCVVSNGEVTVTEVGGPFEKPSSTGTLINGYRFYLGQTAQSCTDVCAGYGGYNDAGTEWATTNTTTCSNVMDALGAAGTGATPGTTPGLGCIVNTSNDRFQESSADASSTNPICRRACACNK